MNVIIKNLDIDVKKPITFVPISDVHVGHIDCDLKYFKDTVAWIKKKGALTVLLGDMVDAIGIKDKRFETGSLDPFFLPYLDNLFQKQAEVFLDIVKPIQKQIIGVLGGNHEATVKKFSSCDVLKTIQGGLEVPLLLILVGLVLNFTTEEMFVI